MKLRILSFALVGLAAICCFAAFAGLSENADRTAHPPGASSGTTANGPFLQRKAETGPVRMVRFVLFKDGIYPGELKVDQGLINIAIEDKTNNTTGLVVERITGSERSRAGEIRRSPNHWRGRSILKLSPGRYEVYDTSRPNNKAILLVQP